MKSTYCRLLFINSSYLYIYIYNLYLYIIYIVYIYIFYYIAYETVSFTYIVLTIYTTPMDYW